MLLPAAPDQRSGAAAAGVSAAGRVPPPLNVLLCACRLTLHSVTTLTPHTCRPTTCSWTDLHAQLDNENRAAVLKAAGRHAPEVMLLPLQGREGPAAPPLPIFAAFMAPLVGGDFVRQVCRG